MKVIIYCQHVLGLGHFFRTLEICRALNGHEVILASGGPETPAALAPHVRRVQLPELAMDQDFKNLQAADNHSIEQTWNKRRAILEQLLADEAPDFFLIELYPLGRKAFRKELDPILEKIKGGRLPACQVVCSVRDILVEKEDQARHETRAVESLNRWFDALLVHADPTVIRLDATFNRVADIRIPVIYTGFVAPPSPLAIDQAAWKIRHNIAPQLLLVVASAGGGAVGYPLLSAVARAIHHLPENPPLQVQMFTGPYMAPEEVGTLQRQSDPRTRIDRFATDFPAWLQAADLSISMAGYNTCMNILTTGVPSMVLPFAQNREQGLRARLLEERGLLEVISADQLDAPSDLALQIATRLQSAPLVGQSSVDINGAIHTAQWLARSQSREVKIS